MDTSLPATEIHCTQCGGELHPEEGQIFLTCPYCSSTVYLDRSRVVFHWFRAPTVDEEKARASLMRWMAGNQTVKDLDRKARLLGSTFEFFPMWYFKHKNPSDKERVLLLPAAATSISELRSLNLPAGDLRKYETAIDSQATQPSVPLQAALNWLSDSKVPQAEIAAQSLVHVPIYTFKYSFQGTVYTAIVEAGTGGVFANLYPAKAETPYRSMGCATAAIFIALAIIPVVWTSIQGAAGTGLGLATCFGLGLIFVPILFAIAAWIAAKV